MINYKVVVILLRNNNHVIFSFGYLKLKMSDKEEMGEKIIGKGKESKGR